MLDLEKFDILRECQPYYIYKRVSLAGPQGYFFHAIDYGFWYLMRRLHCVYADDNLVKDYPDLSATFNLRATNVWPQNLPIPLRLFATPNEPGVRATAAKVTAPTSPKNVKLLNIVYPFRDNIEIYISGHIPPNNPLFVDLLSIGYLIPNDKLYMWEGGKSA